MSPSEFKSQMERMLKTYGPDKYPQERIDLLWAEFKSVEPYLFAGMISRLIGENSTAPMMPKFREALTEVRERSWAAQKKQNSSDAMRGSELLNSPDRDASFSDYVVGLIENKDRDSEAFHWAVKVHGIGKLERIYEQRKKAVAS